jgi:hypothetical protein
MKKIVIALLLGASIVTTAVGCGSASPTKGTTVTSTTAKS